RELNWVTGVGLFILVLAMAITGAFLPWDQAAYWTAVVVTNIPVYTPFIGPFLRALWRGADTIGPTTLSRTFGIHVWLIPAILFPLIGAHLALLRKHGEFGSYVNYLGVYRRREGVDVPPAPKQRPIPLVLVLPTVGVRLLPALPFIDRDPERNPFERPAVMVPGAFAVLFVVLLTLLGSGRLFNL